MISDAEYLFMYLQAIVCLRQILCPFLIGFFSLFSIELYKFFVYFGY